MKIAHLLPKEWPDVIKNAKPFFLGKAPLKLALDLQRKKTDIIYSKLFEYLYSVHFFKRTLHEKKRNSRIGITPEGFYFIDKPDVFFPLSLMASFPSWFIDTTASFCGCCKYNSKEGSAFPQKPLETKFICKITPEHAVDFYSKCRVLNMSAKKFQANLANPRACVSRLQAEADSLEKSNKDPLKSAIESAPERPLLPMFRGANQFKCGHTVHVYFPEKKCFLPGIVCKVVEKQVTLFFKEKMLPERSILQGYGSIFLLDYWGMITKEEIEGLLGDLDYMQWYSAAASNLDHTIIAADLQSAIQALN